MKKQAVHCKTEKQYNDLLKAYEEYTDWKWCDGDKLTEFTSYYKGVCVDFHDRFSQAIKEYKKEFGYKIITFAQAMKLLKAEPSEGKSMDTALCKHEWRACEWVTCRGYTNTKVVTKVFCIHCLTKQSLNE